MGLHSDSRWEIISDRSNSHSCSIMHLTPILFVSRASNITTRSRWIRCRRWATLCRTLSTTTRRQLRSLAWLKSKLCRKPVVKSWVSIKSVFVLTTVKSTVKLRTALELGCTRLNASRHASKPRKINGQLKPQNTSRPGVKNGSRNARRQKLAAHLTKARPPTR